MNIYIYVYQYPSGENGNDSLSRTHQPHCEPLALRSLAVLICNWTVPLSMHARSLLLMAVIATCVFMIFSAALYLYIYIYIEYYTPAVNYIAMENHNLLIGHTSSNGCFSIVMFVFFRGCTAQVVREFKLNASTLRRGPCLQLFTQKSAAKKKGNFENVVSGSRALKTEPIYGYIQI